MIYGLIGVQLILIFFSFYVIIIALSMIIHWKNLLPFFPTNRKVAKKMVQLLELTPEASLVDIGSGWGTLVFQAAPEAGKAVGIERSRYLHVLANLRRRFHRDRNRIMFIHDDAFNTSFSSYSHVIGWWIPLFIKRLQPKLEAELPKGARVVSYMFPFSPSSAWKEQTWKVKKDVIYLYEKIT